MKCFGERCQTLTQKRDDILKPEKSAHYFTEATIIKVYKQVLNVITVKTKIYNLKELGLNITAQGLLSQNGTHSGH